LPFAIDLQGAYGGELQERSERDWRKVRYSTWTRGAVANRQGLTVLGPQKIFDPTLAHIGLLFAKANGIFPAYHEAVSERFWRRALDIEERRAVDAVLAEVGGDTAAFGRYLASPGPQDYAAIVATAEQRGVFGVPTFVLDGELFWGTDRIWLLRERSRGDACGRNLAAIVGEPSRDRTLAAVTRRGLEPRSWEASQASARRAACGTARIAGRLRGEEDVVQLGSRRSAS